MKNRNAALNRKLARVAICHDWLLNQRGAERVLAELCRNSESLSIYTLFFDSDVLGSALERHLVYVSSLRRLPAHRNYYRYLLPFFPRAIGQFQVRDVELLISISHSVAKAIPHDPEVPHICYCLTPMRYLWEPSLYQPDLRSPLKRILLRLLSRPLRSWDTRTNQSVDSFVAVSKTVQQRILRTYGRESRVIYPFVDLDFFRPAATDREDFYLIVSGLVPNKRISLAVEAFNRSGKALRIVGSGPLLRRLRRMARPNVQFLGWQPDDEVRRLYQTARGLVFPGHEDFGLVPVEAQACGCPVIAYGKGGVTESVVAGETGIFFQDRTPEALREAVESLGKSPLEEGRMIQNAKHFSRDRFWSEWRQCLKELGLDPDLLQPPSA